MTTANSSGDYTLVAMDVDKRAQRLLIRYPSGHSQAFLVSNQRQQAGRTAAVYSSPASGSRSFGAWVRWPKPESCRWGQSAFGSNVVAVGSQQLGDVALSDPRATSGSQKTGCAKHNVGVQRPFPVCESLPRTIWVQGFSRSATKIKVDAEHSARLPAPLLELSL